MNPAVIILLFILSSQIFGEETGKYSFQKYLKEKDFETYLASFLEKVSWQLDVIVQKIKEDDLNNMCFIEPVKDKNLQLSSVGWNIEENPKFVRNNAYLVAKCKDPGRYLLSGPIVRECKDGKFTNLTENSCMQLRNEDSWKQTISNMTSLKSYCCRDLIDYETEVKGMDPFNCKYFYQCTKDGISGFSYNRRTCSDNSLYQHVYNRESDYMEYKGHESCLNKDVACKLNKPSIEYTAKNASWNPVGWLMVKKDSDLRLDCIYPNSSLYSENIAERKTSWYFITDEVSREIGGIWDSEFRYRITIEKVTVEHIGLYECRGAVNGKHSIYIGVFDENDCEGVYPDYETHQLYYDKYPFMAAVNQQCNDVYEV